MIDEQTTPSAWPRHVLTLTGLLLVALNLRPALTSVSAVLPLLGRELGLTATAQGILTTLPVLCLGLAAPLAPRLSRHIGSERTILLVLAVLATALLVRPYIGTTGLFLGTILAGGCIGIMGVLLPSLVKRDFPTHLGLMTGLYTMTLNFGAALAAGVTEPIRIGLNGEWRPALAFWLVPALGAAVVWFVHMRLHADTKPDSRKSCRIHHDILTWQVTIYMGLQSSLAYIVFGWLPALLADRGMNAVTAGLALSISVVIQGLAAVVVPTLGTRLRDQRNIITGMLLITLVGFAGCLFAPLSGIWFWVAVLGIGQGGSFSMALTLLALRAPHAEAAAELSGLAQGLGYIVASFGPLAVGLILAAFNTWAALAILLGAIIAGAITAGRGAGRDRVIDARS